MHTAHTGCSQLCTGRVFAARTSRLHGPYTKTAVYTATHTCTQGHVHGHVRVCVHSRVNVDTACTRWWTWPVYTGSVHDRADDRVHGGVRPCTRYLNELQRSPRVGTYNTLQPLWPSTIVPKFIQIVRRINFLQRFPFLDLVDFQLKIRLWAAGQPSGIYNSKSWRARRWFFQVS